MINKGNSKLPSSGKKEEGKYETTPNHPPSKESTLTSGQTSDQYNVQQLLSDIKSIANIGILEWRVKSNLVLWSDDLYKLLGLKPGEMSITKDTFLEFVYHEDKDKLKSLIETIIISQKPFKASYRVQRHDGEIRMVLSQFKCNKDPEGNTSSIRGIVQDITNLDQTEVKLLRLANELEQVKSELEKHKSMQVKLQAKLHKERVKNTQLEKKYNNKLNAKTAALIKGNDELKRTNADLESFMYSASHDLRSPISNLEGLMRILFNDLGEKVGESEKTLINMISTSINKFKKTILDLTEITKVQKGTVEEIEPVSFEEVLEDLKMDIKNLLDESGAIIEHDFQERSIDFALKNLRSIFYNLITNAIKYRSPKRPLKIKIRTLKRTNFIILTIKDNGLGIEKDQHHNLFSMFKRIHTHVEGSGVGLYIIKKIMENHGGKIEVVSTADKGSTFKVFFELNK